MSIKINNNVSNIDYSSIDGISILIPLYNGIEFLQESINSITSQSYTTWEVIIGVNGHDIGSDIYKSASSFSFDKIKVVEFDKTIKGKINTLNEMVKLTKYNIICLLDVDDKWETTKLEKQLEIWKTGKYDVIGTFMKYFGDNNIVPPIPEHIDFKTFFNYNPICNSSIMIHKRDADWTNLCNTLGLNDYNMWFKLMVKGRRFYNVPQVLTYHRIHKQSAFNNSNFNEVPKLLSYWNNKFNNLVTIVTCFYSVKSKFSKSTYLEWISNFLQLEANIIIFMDNDTDILDLIKKYRTNGLDKKTYIINEKLETWETYKYYDYWKYCHSVDIEKERHSPELYMVWNEKTYFINRAINKNPFNSDWFFWTDIGSCRDKNIIKNIKSYFNPNNLFKNSLVSDKILLSFIEPLSKTDYELNKDNIPIIYNNLSELSSCKPVVKVQGGFFGGHLDSWKKWTTQFTETLNNFIKTKTFGGNDQYIMTTAFINYPLDAQYFIPPQNNGDLWFYFLKLFA
jgi:glycosyltransferase involved in cell wall biosynthesis